MPRRYPSRRPYTRPRRPRRYNRRTGRRKRFASKKFKRYRRGVKAGTTIGRTAMVKLNYTKQFASVITGNNWTTPATFGLTYPILSTASSIAFLGSHCATPLGELTFPASFGTATGSLATITEEFPLALQNWASFYEEAICFGSSIHIQMYPVTTDADASCRYFLIPIALQQLTDKLQPNASITGLGYTSLKQQLDNLDLRDLTSYPGCQSGFVKNVYQGPTHVKAFRKTKNMCGLKDLLDNQDELTMELPTAATPGTGTNVPQALPTSDIANASQLGWMWYFRIINIGGASPQYDFTIKIKYYLQLKNRQVLTQI